MCPQQPPARAGLSAGLLEGNLDQGHAGVKRTLLARRILAAQAPSPRIPQMSTHPDDKVKLSGPPLSRCVSTLCLRAPRGTGVGPGLGREPPPPAPAIV